jgi:hypothetical protein
MSQERRLAIPLAGLVQSTRLLVRASAVVAREKPIERAFESSLSWVWLLSQFQLMIQERVALPLKLG